MRSICLLVVFVAVASAAVPRHPEVIRRPATRTKTGTRVPPAKGNGPNGNGNGPNGKGWSAVIADFLQVFKQAPPAVQREIVTAFTQVMPPAPVAPAVQAPPRAQAPPAARAAPVIPPTKLKSAPRPAYTYQGRPALFNPAELNNDVPPVGQYPAPQPPAPPAQPAFDFLQFYHLFTDAPEIKKGGKYTEY